MLCRYLYSKDHPITHWENVFDQFDISIEDFTTKNLLELIFYISDVAFFISKPKPKSKPNPPNKDLYVGTIIDVRDSNSKKTVYFIIENIFNNRKPINIYISKTNGYNVNTIRQYIGKTLTVLPGDCEMYGSHPFIRNFDPSKYIF